MNISWDTPLKKGQLDNPVIYYEYIDLPPDIHRPTNDQIAKVFGGELSKSQRLKTWGRSLDEDGNTVLTNDPHYIAVLNGTPLHYDPKYPRFSHHLKIRVDAGTTCRGKNKAELKLVRGMFYILDTHSPHQVLCKSKESWNVSLSIDSHNIENPKEILPQLIEYGLNSDFITGVVS